MDAMTPQTTDPRIAHTRRVVQRAALSELAAVGFGAFTIEGVAARSKVAKSTIYRHWDGKLALIADALETLNEQPVPAPADGSAREQIASLLRHLADALTDPVLSPTIPAMIEAAERDSTIAQLLHEYSDRRRRTLVEVISAHIASGELASTLDPELAALALSAPVFYSRFMTGQAFPPERIDDLIDAVLGR
jgi:TetR/AcrR family transcriptional regulator of autoinduction and epiphytic fitness